jgi:S-DNA-T family DNA segregation ATPase FtsK/SpoIIIE
MARDVPVTVAVGDKADDLLLHWAPPASVRDLRSVLGLPPNGKRLHADGVPLPVGQLLDDAPLAPGVRLSDVAGAPERSPSGLLLCQLTGTEAGRAVRLGAEEVVLGRSSGAEVTLADREASRRHCTVAAAPDGATVTDLGSSNGTWLEGEVVGSDPVSWVPGAVLRVGTTYFCLTQVDALPLPPGRGGEPAIFHRSPRTIRPRSRDPHDRGAAITPGNLPPHPDKQRTNAAIGVTAILSPLVLSGVLYATTHQITSALYGLMGAVAVVGGYFETKRRSRKEGKRAVVERTDLLATFRQDLDRAAVDDARLAWRLHPSPAECLARAEGPGARLWECRSADPDFLDLLVGVGSTSWTAPVGGMPQDDEARQILRERALQHDAAVSVSLAVGRVLSLALPRGDALASARSLLTQAMTLHGPADLRIVLVLDAEFTGASDWDWLRWAPHPRGPHTFPWVVLADDDGDIDAALQPVLSPESGTPDLRHVLVVLDGEGLLAAASPLLRAALTEERNPGARDRDRPKASLLVVGGRASEASTTVVRPGSAPGLVSVSEVATGTAVDGVLPVTMTAELADRCTRALAGHADPLLVDVSAGVPDIVPLHELLPVDLGRGDDAVAVKITERWRAATNKTLEVPVGGSSSGVFSLDLVKQGPHALIGGTSGSGKSELLKTLCASLAATYPPELMVFGLFDFKGGTALQELRALPHCVGLVADTDLLEAERAMRYLQSELLHREEQLFEAGVGDITEYPGIMPRLVVVIDEFQILSERLPDLLQSVIDITKRGRSLGVHLVFATQSPTSVRNYEELRKNTRLRVTLRLEDAADSQALIEVPDAATFSTVGRALARLGAGSLRLFQSGWTGADPDASGGADITARPFALLPRPAPVAARAASTEGRGNTEMSAVIAGVLGSRERDVADGVAAPPADIWPDPLPPNLAREGLTPPGPNELLLGLGDDPEATREHRRPVITWDLGAGNLVVHGVVGSGTTSTLLTIAVGIAERFSADEAQLVGLDFAGGELAAIAALPHCAGNVITSGEIERQSSGISLLRALLARRSKMTPVDRAGEPKVFVFIDNIGTLAQTYSSGRLRHGQAMLEDLAAVAQQGPSVGVWMVASAAGTTVPYAINATITQRVVLALADIRSYGDLDLKVTDIPRRPGRGMWRTGRTAIDMQVALPAAGLENALADLASGPPPTVHPPMRMRELPFSVDADDLAQAVALDAQDLHLPVGLAAGSVEPAVVSLGHASRMLVYGPARCGKTSLLLRTARLIHDHLAADVGVYVIATPGSPLLARDIAERSASSEVEITTLVELLRTQNRPVLLLVDDVDKVGSALNGLFEDQPPGVRVIAAARVGNVRSPEYGTSAYLLRSVEQRLVVQPDPNTGDPVTGRYFDFGAVERAPGRGFLVTVEGDTVVQI